METANQNQPGTSPETNQSDERKIAKRQLDNKLVFIEYESALPNGHFITVTDRYKNILGRIHRIHDPKAQDYKYKAYDEEGSLQFEKEKIWEIKKEFINQKQVLMEKAHQKRLAKMQEVRRDKSQQKTKGKTQASKPTEIPQEQKQPGDLEKQQQARVQENTQEYENEMQKESEKEERMREIEELRGRTQDREPEISR